MLILKVLNNSNCAVIIFWNFYEIDITVSGVFFRLSNVVILHFVEGLQNNNVENLSFTFGGRNYRVRGLIQYLSNPDHFVTWIYDDQGNYFIFPLPRLKYLCMFVLFLSFS